MRGRDPLLPNPDHTGVGTLEGGECEASVTNVDETEGLEEARQRVISRRRTGKILIIAFLVVIAIAEVITFASRATTAADDAKPEVYYGAPGSTGPNYIAVQAHIVEISAASGTQQVRLVVVPHGSFATPSGALASPVNLDADGYSGGSITLAPDVIPPPIQLTLDLNGDLSQYPFDRYQSSLTVDLAPVRIKLDGTYGSPQFSKSVPMRLLVASNQHDWVTSSKSAHASIDGSVAINLYAQRGVATIGFALFELFIMMALAVIAVSITFAAIVSVKPLEFSLFVWLGAMLFALPAIRSTMPGVPGVGTVVDYTIFFWCLIAVAGCLIVAAITYIRNSFRAHHQHK